MPQAEVEPDPDVCLHASCLRPFDKHGHDAAGLRHTAHTHEQHGVRPGHLCGPGPTKAVATLGGLYKNAVTCMKQFFCLGSLARNAGESSM